MWSVKTHPNIHDIMKIKIFQSLWRKFPVPDFAESPSRVYIQRLEKILVVDGRFLTRAGHAINCSDSSRHEREMVLCLKVVIFMFFHLLIGAYLYSPSSPNVCNYQNDRLIFHNFLITTKIARTAVVSRYKISIQTVLVSWYGSKFVKIVIYRHIISVTLWR